MDKVEALLTEITEYLETLPDWRNPRLYLSFWRTDNFRRKAMTKNKTPLRTYTIELCYGNDAEEEVINGEYTNSCWAHLTYMFVPIEELPEALERFSEQVKTLQLKNPDFKPESTSLAWHTAEETKTENRESIFKKDDE